MAYPRIHRGNGTWFDLPFVEPEREASYEAEWRAVHCRVEWLASLTGRLDHLLPQNLPRIVANANARSYRSSRYKRNVTG